MTGFEHLNWLNHADTNQAGSLKVTRNTFNIALMEKLASDKKSEKRKTLSPHAHGRTLFKL